MPSALKNTALKSAPRTVLALVVAVLAFALPCASTAQMRTLPQDTERGYIAPLEGSKVLIDGRPMRLAPGATIRNQENLIIVPSALPPEGARAEYTLDADGAIFRAWLVTDREATRERPRR